MSPYLKWIGSGALLLAGTGSIGVMHWVSVSNEQIARQESVSAELNAPGQFVTVNGRSLHVLIKGDLQADPTGAPLMLIHGFSAAGHATWLPWAEQLYPHRSVVLVDLLGYGHSERVLQPHHDLTHRGQTALLAALLVQLQVPLVDIAGWSMGAAIAAQYTLDYPARVRALALIAPHIYGVNDFNPGRIIGALPDSLSRAMVWNSLGAGPAGITAQNCTRNGEWCHWLPLLHIAGTVDSLRAISATPRDTLIPDGIAGISAPTLVVAGEADPIVPAEDSRRLANQLQAEYFVARGAGHWPAEQEPLQVARLILEFFQNTRSGRTGGRSGKGETASLSAETE